MITYPIKKLFGGKATVRSCVVDHARKMKQSIQITYQNASMVINGDTPYTITSPPQVAKLTDEYIRAGEFYYLQDYDWNPQVVKVEDYTQDGLFKLHSAMKEVFGKK